MDKPSKRCPRKSMHAASKAQRRNPRPPLPPPSNQTKHSVSLMCVSSKTHTRTYTHIYTRQSERAVFFYYCHHRNSLLAIPRPPHLALPASSRRVTHEPDHNTMIFFLHRTRLSPAFYSSTRRAPLQGDNNSTRDGATKRRDEQKKKW